MTHDNGPSQACKDAGLPSLAYVSKSASVPIRTLRDWFHNKPALFAVVLAGVKSIKGKGDE